MWPHRLCGCVAAWLCGWVAMWLCGYVAAWLCGYVAVWLCGYVAVWLCGSRINCVTLTITIQICMHGTSGSASSSILHRLQSLRPMLAIQSPPGLWRRRGGAKAMTKGALMKAISSASHVNQKHCRKVLSSLRTLALQEVKKTGVFAIPGLCRMKKLDQPARSEHTATILGKIVPVQARPARTVVKASPLRALKKQI